MEAELPQDALLRRYGEPHYTDCFAVTVPGSVELEEYVFAFYTAPLFRCERVILKLIGRGSTDADAERLLRGESKKFAAWSLEDRNNNQLLMCDFQSRTRSWFKVEPYDEQTRLYFGSAVTADRSGSVPSSYQVLMGLHRFYSRRLLSGARRRVKRNGRRGLRHN